MRGNRDAAALDWWHSSWGRLFLRPPKQSLPPAPFRSPRAGHHPPTVHELHPPHPLTKVGSLLCARGSLPHWVPSLHAWSGTRAAGAGAVVSRHDQSATTELSPCSLRTRQARCTNANFGALISQAGKHCSAFKATYVCLKGKTEALKSETQKEGEKTELKIIPLLGGIDLNQKGFFQKKIPSLLSLL